MHGFRHSPALAEKIRLAAHQGGQDLGASLEFDEISVRALGQGE